MVGVGDRRVVDADVPGHPLPPLLAAVAALAGARPVHSQVWAGHLAQQRFKTNVWAIKYVHPFCCYKIDIENKNLRLK